MKSTEILSFERPYDKKGPPGCGIYFYAPKTLELNLFAVQMRYAFDAINGSPYEKNMHAIEFSLPKRLSDERKDVYSKIIQICKRNGVVSIIRNDLHLCAELGAEGVMIEDASKILQAKELLGSDFIVGADGGDSEKMAKTLLSKDIDYVSFSGFFPESRSKYNADLSLLDWWNAQSPHPAVANTKLNVSRVAELVRAGAGFIGAGNWVWDHKEGPAKAVQWLQEAIELGLSDQRMTKH